MLAMFLQDYKLRMSDWKCQSDILILVLFIFLCWRMGGHIVHWVTVSTLLLLNLQWSSLAVTALSWMLAWVCIRSDWGNPFSQLQVVPSILLPNELPTELQRILFKEKNMSKNYYYSFQKKQAYVYASLIVGKTPTLNFFLLEIHDFYANYKLWYHDYKLGWQKYAYCETLQIIKKR